MLSQRERLAAIALARMSDMDRERVLSRGFVMINLDTNSVSGRWTPVNLGPAVIDAATDFRRNDARDVIGAARSQS